MLRFPFLIAICSLMVAGCDAPTSGGSGDRAGIGPNGRRDLRGAGVNVSGEKEGKPYAVYDAARDQTGTGLAFAGYGCMRDCADVMTGYRRARRDKITNPRLCSAPTWGELEGCVAFAQGLPSELSSLPPLKAAAAP
jgi:hypothetical protein